MVQIKKEDKTKVKNWVDGDTFAVKIENIDPEYDGKYLILTKFNFSENFYKYPLFHVKITPGNTKPQTLEEINKLENVKTMLTLWNDRFFPFLNAETLEEWKKRNRGKKFYPDKYNYLYSYAIYIYFRRGEKLDNFEYLGNFDIIPPFGEFVSVQIQLYLNDPTHPNYFVKKVLKEYKDNNLQKGYFFTKEGIKEGKRINKKTMQVIKHRNTFTKYKRKTDPEWKREDR